jgi:hypothetical protein
LPIASPAGHDVCPARSSNSAPAKLVLLIPPDEALHEQFRTSSQKLMPTDSRLRRRRRCAKERADREDEALRAWIPLLHARRQIMTTTRVPLAILGLLAGVAIVAPGITSVSASFARSGSLQVEKECSDYQGQPGQFCTITSSSISEITPGSKVFYTQPLGVPAGMLDSNVVLDAGEGNRAIGRCTLDLSTGLGLCTFSDGTGHFAGFHARVEVSAPAHAGDDWHWRGTYGFNRPGVTAPRD